MRRIILPLVLLTALVLTGCPKDDRAKRLASGLNVKTKVAKEEFKAAATPEKKIQIAADYFDNADQMTQTIEDYMFSRKPADTVPVPSK